MTDPESLAASTTPSASAAGGGSDSGSLIAGASPAARCLYLFES